MTRKITKKEIRQMFRWLTLGVGTFFIYFYMREKVMEIFPDGHTQLIVGVILLFIAAYFFDITKYGG